ncbi:ABC transporter ATP-binding protein [Seleniivibrio woodruffii]|uniref:Molybdate transport system ATP-binding protein n=1 Tax=Seleniivibrio woodruffii TaxID=1078050 RepID=A0A4R1KCA5_9BACT|nr:molybdate transport system ATP-binding protein [Seleniivibrio woodruffii]TVZ34707.1 molybdate transport system ATP-binding protein [Seleniivibrio woodruffii]
MIEIDVVKRIKTASGEVDMHAKVDIEKGGFCSLFGKSGAGKTTILRILAGLTDPDDGVIRIDGKVWFDKKNRINVPVNKRKCGFVFQDYALFPNMTVRKNVEYASVNRSNVDRLIDMVGMTELTHRKPATLSGGQRQRVALARALAAEPEILLLDEPFAALDADMRNVLQNELKVIHDTLGVTTILVSHDKGEVFKLADKVYCMDDGVITRIGTPEEVFTDSTISGKFKFTARVLKIERSDCLYVLTLSIGSEVGHVVATRSEAEDISIGDRVLVYTKAFNPSVKKI